MEEVFIAVSLEASSRTSASESLELTYGEFDAHTVSQ